MSGGALVTITAEDIVGYLRVRIAASDGYERAEWQVLLGRVTAGVALGIRLTGSDYWFLDEEDDDRRRAKCEARRKVYTEFLGVT